MTTPEIQGLSDFCLIHEGSSFITWRARQASLDRDVEVRQISPSLPESQIQHHLRMARLLAKMSHTSIAQVYDINPDVKPPYILAEYASSPSLSDIIEKKGLLSSREALKIALCIAEALAYAGTQAPLILRNIKPQNIHLDGNGVLKLTDFSLAIIAKDPNDGPSVDGDDLVGTPNFVSPEHAECKADIDPRSDMYSLGMLLYYLTTRRVPFDCPDGLKTFELQRTARLEDPRKLNPDLPDSFVNFLVRLTMKDPANRYDAWSDVLGDIKKLLDRHPLPAKKMPAGARSSIELKAAEAAPSSNTAVRDEIARERKRRGHPLAWFVLILWLAWLANCRLNNPAQLPAKFAPQINIPALDRLVEKVNDMTKNRGQKQESETPSSKEEEIDFGSQTTAESVDLPEAAAPEESASTDALPSYESADNESDPVAEPVTGSQYTEEQPAAPAVSTASVPVDVKNLAEEIGAQLRGGNISSACERCQQINSIAANEAAKLLAQTPGIDAALADAILAHKGEAVSLTYMGKARTVTPVRIDDKTLVTMFTDNSGLAREVKLELGKIDDAQKFAFLDTWAGTSPQHVTAAVAALKAGDSAGVRRHASQAGALSQVLAILAE